MLSHLEIENIAVIEKTEISFSPGLNVLTGETGAGKSIIIDSINMILGERTSRELVRTGASGASVTALFESVSPAVLRRIANLGLDLEEDGTVLIRRSIQADGKGVCRLNGKVITASMLREIGRMLVNIHGQHDSQALLNPEKHLLFLDMLLKDKTVKQIYRERFQNLVSIKRERDALSAGEEEKERQAELLRYQIEEIESAEIQPGEQEKWTQRRNQINHSEKMLEALNRAYTALNGSDEFSGAAVMAGDAARALDGIAGFDSGLESLSGKVAEAGYLLEEYSSEIRRALDSAEFDPLELEQIEERLDLLYRLEQKYGGSEEAVLRHLQEAKAKLAAMESAEERLAELEGTYQAALEEALLAAQVLSEERKKAACWLEEKVSEELRFLDMPHVQFQVRREEGPLSVRGRDGIEFLISTNPGEPPKPLAKIASGGELSRIMLAVKSVIAVHDQTGTLIFDEIDTGVSGRGAQKIGMKLRQVSRNCQVLCVTHSAQVAAHAAHHLYIEKEVREGRTYTQIWDLETPQRVQELARIMGGEPITPLQLENAAEMLKNATSS